MEEEKKMCAALTASGDYCKRAAKPDSDFCGTHESKEERTALVDVKLPYINIQVHWLNKAGLFGMEHGPSWPKEAIEERIQQLHELGYRMLGNPQYLGDNPEAYGMMFVLVLDATSACCE